MMMLLLAFAAGLLGYLLVRKLLSKAKTEKTRAEDLASITPWIHEVVERSLTRKLSLGERVGTALSGNPDPDVVSSVEQAVDKIELEFVKYSHDEQAEIHLHITFEDGTRNTEWTSRPFGELPPTVREDFTKKAVTRLFRTWEFPWATRSVA